MILIIRPDLHNERSGFVRAYTTESLDAPTCCPVIGYCSPGGSHRTGKACLAELRRLRICTGMPVYYDRSRRFLAFV